MFPTGKIDCLRMTNVKYGISGCNDAAKLSNTSTGDTYTRPASTAAIRISSLAESPLIAARIAFSAHQNNSR
jgi:hypothetical protein